MVLAWKASIFIPIRMGQWNADRPIIQKKPDPSPKSYGDPRSHRFLAPILCPMSYVDGWVPNRFGSTQISSKRLFGYTLSDGNIIAVPIMNPSPTLSNLGCINHPKSSKHSRFIIRFTMFTTFYTLHLLCCLPLALQVFKFSRLSHPCLGR